MSSVTDFIKPIKDFSSKTVPAQIEILGWYLHEAQKKERFSGNDILNLFDELHLTRPSNISTALSRLCSKRPARIIKDTKGFRLAAEARRETSAIAPIRHSAAEATSLLKSLLPRIANPDQKTFLSEALICFSQGAYRAAIIMSWNLAFSHLLDKIYSSHLIAFNDQVGTNNFKRPIVSRIDLSELKESDIIKIARAAKIISGETQKILNEKLGKRNSAAHPSSTIISTSTAEEVIFDLVENIILKQHI